MDNLFSGRAFWFAAGLTVLIFLAGIYTPYFIVDSWSYLELSKTVSTDFYRFNTLRQFENPSPYSAAFPPLWPILLAGARWIADLGIYTGYALNCLVCIGLLAGLMRLFQRIGLPGWAGAASYLLLLGFPPFFQDALGAKTGPLACALLIAALVLLCAETVSVARVAAGGLLMGLACLTRFDAVAAACLLGAAFAVRAYLPRRRLVRAAVMAAIYFAVLGISLAPWAVFGMRHFGKLFPNDHSRQILRAQLGNGLDYYETPPPADLSQSPGKWVAGLLKFKLPSVLFGFYDAAFQSAIPPLLGMVLVVWGAARPRAPAAAPVRFIIVALALIPALLLPTVAAGYRDSRYYSAPVLLLFAVLLVFLVTLTPGAWTSRRIALLLLACTLPLGADYEEPLLSASNGVIPLSISKAMVPISATPEMQALTEAVRRDSKGAPHRLILTTGYIATARYGALTGEPVSLMPRFDHGSFAAFARDWHITHVYDPPVKPAPHFGPPVADSAVVMGRVHSAGVELEPLDFPGLYRIRIGPSVPR